MPIDWSDGKAPAGRVVDDPEQDKLADAVADEILGAASSQYQGPHMDDEGNLIPQEKSSGERLEIERTVYQFMKSFGAQLTERLLPAGIHCERMIVSGNKDGFDIDCRDREGRQYSAFLGMDEYLEKAQTEESAGRFMLGVVCDRIIEARAKYFARMQ